MFFLKNSAIDEQTGKVNECVILYPGQVNHFFLTFRNSKFVYIFFLYNFVLNVEFTL